MNNCIKEFANITRIQNIQLVRSIGKDKGWNIDELITIINSRDISYYKNLFDLVVEDELNKCFQKSKISTNNIELEPYILGNELYYIDANTNIYNKDLLPLNITLNSILVKRTIN